MTGNSQQSAAGRQLLNEMTSEKSGRSSDCNATPRQRVRRGHRNICMESGFLIATRIMLSPS